MGIPDDLSRSHDQLEQDGTVEEDQLLVSLRFLGLDFQRTLNATRPVDREAMVAAAILRPQDRMRVPNVTQ